MKPVALARRPADVEDGVRVGRGMRPCADGCRYRPGRRIRTTSRRINTNSVEAFCSIILSFGSEPTARDRLSGQGRHGHDAGQTSWIDRRSGATMDINHGRRRSVFWDTPGADDVRETDAPMRRTSFLVKTAETQQT